MARSSLILVAVLAVLSGATHAADPSPEALFDDLFGPRFRAVSATDDPSDNIELADQMLQTLPSLDSAADLQRLICEKAYELTATSPEGVDVAVRSMQLLADRDPDSAVDCQDRIVRTLTVAYSRLRGDERDAVAPQLAAALEKAGDLRVEADDATEAVRLYLRAQAMARSNDQIDADGLRTKIERTREQAQTYRRIEQYKARIKRNPEDRVAGEELVMAYVVDLDRPAAAAKYSFLVDPKLAERVSQAAKPVDSLEPSASLDLAKWYEQAASSLPESKRTPMLARSAGYYRRFIDAEPDAASTDLTIAKVKLSQIEKQLAEADRPEPEAASGEWRSLFPKGDKLTGWTAPDDPSAIEYKDGRLVLTKPVDVRHPVGASAFVLRGVVSMRLGTGTRVNIVADDRTCSFILRPGIVRLVGHTREPVTKPLKLGDSDDTPILITVAGTRIVVNVAGEDVFDVRADSLEAPLSIGVSFKQGDESVEFKQFQVRPLSREEAAKLAK